MSMGEECSSGRTEQEPKNLDRRERDAALLGGIKSDEDWKEFGRQIEKSRRRREQGLRNWMLQRESARQRQPNTSDQH